jgi:NAD(P)H dehydrogenase (quinone)
VVILVTGAAGKTGRAVIRALARRGQAVRALVRSSSQLAVVQALGAQEAVVGDMRVPSAVSASMEGVRAVYHIGPNMSPHESEMGEIAIDAARRADVEHLVYHSVLHPQTQDMPHHWQKLRVEELLFKSGLPFTIVQPTIYMDNVLAYWDAIVERGVYAVPYGPDTVLGMVDLQDVAAAAAEVLTQPGHIGATYEAAGAEALDQTEVTRTLSKTLGRVVRVEKVTLDEWEQRARATGLGNYAVDALKKMFRYYEDYGFWGNPRMLTWLLRRPPTRFAEFAERVAGQRRHHGLAPQP